MEREYQKHQKCHEYQKNIGAKSAMTTRDPPTASLSLPGMFPLPVDVAAGRGDDSDDEERHEGVQQQEPRVRGRGRLHWGRRGRRGGRLPRELGAGCKARPAEGAT